MVSSVVVILNKFTAGCVEFTAIFRAYQIELVVFDRSLIHLGVYLTVSGAYSLKVKP
jgi:hypothetical protein